MPSDKNIADIHKKERRYLILILGIVALSTLFKLFYVFKLTAYPTFLFSDCWGYWSRAQERFAGNIFSENQWNIMPPGYHIILAEMFKIINFLGVFRYKLEIILTVQIILCSLSVYALYRIALMTVHDHLVALMAAGTYAFSFVIVFFKAFILSENIAIPLVILSLYFLFKDKLAFFIVSGILLAVATWVRPWYIILFLLFTCYLVFDKNNWSIKSKKTLSFTLPFIIITILAIAENGYISKGKIRGLDANGGIAFYLALAKPHLITFHSPDGGYTYFSPPNTLDHPEYGNIDTTVPFNNNKYYYELGASYIKKNPLVLLKKFIGLKDMLFSPLFPNTPNAKWFSQLVGPSRWIMFVMLLFSLMIGTVFKSGRADNAKLWLLVSIPIGLLTLNYFFNTEYRYFYAFAFVIHILCFSSIVEILRSFSYAKHQDNLPQEAYPKMLNNDYRSVLINVLLVLGSLLVGFILVELVVRPHHLKFENLILKDEGDLVNKFYARLYRYDSTLGWLPLSNVSVEKWGGQVTLLNDEIRSNGVKPELDNDISVLALGDSFTFGDQVPDDKTWPSLLEQLTHSRVYNAGVSSYGLDQIILRLEKEKLVAKYHPQVIILSIIYDDIERCLQTIRHGDPKPYFILKNNKLFLQKQQKYYGIRFDFFRRILGYSYVCNKIMGSLFPSYWKGGTSQDFRNIKGDGLRVSELLFDEFMKTAKSKDVIFLVQEWAQWDLLESLIKYIKFTYPKVHIVNLPPVFNHIHNTYPQEYNSYFSGHMTPKGNKFVAHILASEIMTFPDVRLAHTLSSCPRQELGH